MGGKTKRRTPRVGYLCKRSCLYTLTHPKHPRDSEQGPPAGCPPPGLAGIPPGKGSGCPPARPQSSLSASSSPASPFAALAARPAHSPHSSMCGPRAHPRPKILLPHNSAARERIPVPRYTQNQPLHTHIPPATPISVALPSLTYPGSGGAEPALSPIFLYRGMRFFSLSLCRSEERTISGSVLGPGMGLSLA